MSTAIVNVPVADVQSGDVPAAASLDIQQALAYAEALTGARGNPLSLLSIRRDGRVESRWGSVADLWPWITAQQERGAGIYATVNETAGTDRKKDDIKRIRALWIDADERAERFRDDFPVPPHFVVESSPGKFHYYWRTDDVRSDLAEQVMDRMVAAHPGGDKSAKDVARVLRLPGTLHLKGDPFLCRIVSQREGAPVSLEQMQDAWARAAQDDDLPGCEPLGATALLETIEQGAPGVHDALLRLSAQLVSKGVSPRVAEALLTAFTQQHSDGTPRMAERIREIPRLVKSAVEKYQPADAFDESAPADLFATADATQVAFSTEHYPTGIAALAQDISRRVGCDPLIPAWTALAACAGLLPDRLVIQPKAFDTAWTEAPRLWVAFVGEPSAKKSPGMAEVLRPVERIQSNLAASHASDMARWREQCAAARRAKEPDPDASPMRRVLINDATVESVAVILAENPEGVLSVQDELSGWFGSHDAYRPSGTSKDRAFWLQAYNGGAHTVDRVNKSIHVPHLSVSIVGGIQPGPMRKIAEKIEDDGLLQRFIPIPIRAAEAGDDVAPEKGALDGWESLVGRLYEMRIGEYSLQERCRLAPGAQTAMTDAMRRLDELANDPSIDGRLRSALAKGAGQLSRLVLIYHAIEGYDELLCDVPREVPEATARRAIAAYFDLIVAAQRHFYAAVVGETTTQRNARLVAGYVLAKARDGICERDLYREALKNADERARGEAMRALELAGWLKPEKEFQGKVNRWTVNPSVHRLFAERAELERERRAAVVRKIRRGG